MPNFPKKQQQCLIPKYLLDYATELNENHPDPTAPWGGGGGSPIEAGTGIVITGDETKTISVDTEDVAMKTDIPTKTSELTNDSGFITGINSSDVINALGYTPGTSNFSGSYNDLENKPTNLVTTDGSEIITGSKTFESPIIVKDNSMSMDQAQYKYDSINYTNPSYNITLQPNANSSGTMVIDLPEQSGTLATTGDIPTDVSDLYNDAGYITGITSTDVTNALGYTPYDSSNPSGYITGINSSDVITALGYTPGTSNFSGSYNDLTDKPTIPTVGDGTITIQKNGTAVDTFTTNQSSNKSINITVPTDTNDLTNGAGYITSSALTDYVTDDEFIFDASSYSDGDNIPLAVIDKALGAMHIKYDNRIYTKMSNDSSAVTKSWNYTYLVPLTTGKYTYEKLITIRNTYPHTISISTESYRIAEKTSELTNDSGFITNTVNNLTNYTLTSNLATVATTGSYNDLSNKPTIPTATSQLTNDSGFITSASLSGYGKVITKSTGTNFTADEVTQLISDGTTLYIDDECYIKNYYNSSPFYLFYSKVNASTGVNDVIERKQISINSDGTWTTTTDTITLADVATSGDYDDLTNKPDLSIYAQSANLATVATSGSYADLSNKPTIPTTATSTSTFNPTTETLVFTYTDNTTANITIVTAATVTTTTTLS